MNPTLQASIAAFLAKASVMISILVYTDFQASLHCDRTKPYITIPCPQTHQQRYSGLAALI